MERRMLSESGGRRRHRRRNLPQPLRVEEHELEHTDPSLGVDVAAAVAAAASPTPTPALRAGRRGELVKPTAGDTDRRDCLGGSRRQRPARHPLEQPPGGRQLTNTPAALSPTKLWWDTRCRTARGLRRERELARPRAVQASSRRRCPQNGMEGDWCATS